MTLLEESQEASTVAMKTKKEKKKEKVNSNQNEEMCGWKKSDGWRIVDKVKKD